MRRSVLEIALLLVVVSFLGGWTWLWESDAGEGEPRFNTEWFGKGWKPGEAERRDLKQNHRIHTQEEEIECVECHAGAQDEDRAGMPEEEVCVDCHEETDHDAKDKSGCLYCHTFAKPNPACTEESCAEEDLPEIVTNLGPAPYRNLRYPTEGDEAGFSHSKHFKAEIECVQCHDDVAKEEQIPFPSGKYMPKPQRCFDCHAKDLGHFKHSRHKQKEVECGDCHEDITESEETPMPDDGYRPPGVPAHTPETCRDCHDPVSTSCETCHEPGTFDRTIERDDHNGKWTEFHGLVAEFNFKGEHGKACATCHARTDCITCHNTERPRDHNNFWRNRAHGLMAEGNRERCQTCHRQDFCVACHNETAPRTHMGSWGTGRHCAWCHLGSGSSPESNCRVCHPAVMHTSAPHPINANTLDCLQCHDPVSGRAVMRK